MFKRMLSGLLCLLLLTAAWPCALADEAPTVSGYLIKVEDGLFSLYLDGELIEATKIGENAQVSLWMDDKTQRPMITLRDARGTRLGMITLDSDIPITVDGDLGTLLVGISYKGALTIAEGATIHSLEINSNSAIEMAGTADLATINGSPDLTLTGNASIGDLLATGSANISLQDHASITTLHCKHSRSVLSLSDDASIEEATIVRGTVVNGREAIGSIQETAPIIRRPKSSPPSTNQKSASVNPPGMFWCEWCQAWHYNGYIHDPYPPYPYPPYPYPPYPYPPYPYPPYPTSTSYFCLQCSRMHVWNKDPLYVSHYCYAFWGY